MTETLNEFLTFFGIQNLLNISSDITVGQFLGMVIVAFIAVIITAIGIRSIVEFIKILTNFKNFS